MRVLHVNERAGFHGGVEQILHDMALGLAERGHPQALLHRDPEPRPELLSAFEATGSDAGADSDGGPALIDGFRPDVVLIHKLESAGRIHALAERLPTVRMVHDHDLVCLRRHKYFPINTRICDRPAGLACYSHLCFIQRAAPGGRLPIRLSHVGERRRAIDAHAQVRRFIVGSRWMREELAVNGIPAGRVDVLPPVPRTLGEIQPLPPSGEPEVLFVGQIIRGKGVDLMLRALAEVRPPWHATVVGAGNHLDWCRALAGELGIARRVSFTGWVDHARLQDYYARAALSVVPSRWPEPFGMVGIEAMARGRPVVGFAAGGIPDWLEDGVTGLLAPEADHEALGRHIARLLADPALAARLGCQAAGRVQERYRADRFLDELTGVLERAVAAPAAPD